MKMTVYTHLFLLLLQACCVVAVGFNNDSVTNDPFNNGTVKSVDITTRRNIQTEYTITGHSTAIANSPASDPYTLQNMFNEDPCNTHGTCAVVNTSECKYCNCDEQCHVYNDCCYDLLTENSIRDSTFDCLDSDSVFPTPGGYFVISKCLNETFRTELHAKCENNDILLIGPWVYGNDGIIYRNKHCAECNGLTTFEPFSLWFYNVPTTYIDDHINKTQEERFTILLNQSKNGKSYRQVYYRWESPVALDTRMQCIMVAPVTNTSSRNCQMYAHNPVTLPNDIYTAYRNIYYAPSETTNIICASFLAKLLLRTNIYFDVYPLNIIFSFVQKTSDGGCDKVDGLGQTHELYKNMEVEKGFSLISNTSISDSLLKKVIFSLVLSLVDSPNVTVLKYVKAIKAKKENISSIVLAHIRVKYEIVKGFYSSDITHHIRKIENADLRIRIKFNTSYTVEMFSDTDLYEPFEYRMDCLINHHFLKDDNIALFMNNQFIKIQTNVDDPFCDSVTVDTTYDNQEEFLLISQVRCKNYDTDTYLTITSDNVGTIITYTGASVSIILLIISVMVNRKAGLARSVPGGNVQNLSVSLVIANLLFVAGIGANDYQMVCLVVGILLHYFWLLVFSFMSVTIVYMFRNIRSMIAKNTGEQHDICKTKIKLTILGIIIPFTIVAPSCVLEYLGFTQFTPHYTGNICFPTSFPGNSIFVTGPIMISLAVNIICLVVTITFLYQHKEKTKHIRKSQSYQQIPLYLRMSVLTGSFWIIGIIGAVFNSEVINYIFIIICSLQGFMIAVSNLTTKAIRKEFRSKRRLDALS